VAAALNAMGHSGYTLCSTPPNVRPTVRDYHYSYTQGEPVLQDTKACYCFIPCGDRQGYARPGIAASCYSQKQACAQHSLLQQSQEV
jgi:hypothetical protein